MNSVSEVEAASLREGGSGGLAAVASAPLSLSAAVSPEAVTQPSRPAALTLAPAALERARRAYLRFESRVPVQLEIA